MSAGKRIDEVSKVLAKEYAIERENIRDAIATVWRGLKGRSLALVLDVARPACSIVATSGTAHRHVQRVALEQWVGRLVVASEAAWGVGS